MCPPDHLRDRVRDQSLDVPPTALRPRTAGRPMARPAAAAGRGGGAGCLHAAGRGPARPDLHGQRGADLSATWPYPSRFRYPQRQVEVPHDEHWLAEPRLPARGRCRAGMFFEGAGDALFCGDTLFAGYRIRSDVRSASRDRHTVRLPRDSRWSWSIRSYLPPRHLLLPLGGPAWRSIIRRPSTTTAGGRCGVDSAV